MFRKIKNTVISIILLLLTANFVLRIGDPQTTGQPMDSGLAIYTGLRSVIDMIYMVSGYIMAPIYSVYGAIGAAYFKTNPWFPYLKGSTILNLGATDEAYGFLNNPPFPQIFRGYVDWLIVIMLVLVKILDPLLNSAFEFVKNFIWNIFIEFSFTKKKRQLYQEKLEERASDLMKMKVQYRNLSKEASQLAEAVVKDELTNMYNKRFFIEKVKYEFDQAKANKTIYSIAMVDIDHFKKLNDTYGHLMGDKVLKDVAKACIDASPKDCFPCRFGGEEFAIIMPGKPFDMAYKISQVAHEKIPTLRYEEDPELVVTASIGLFVGDFTDPECQKLQSFDEAVKFADDELYRAKLGGRNQIQYKAIPDVPPPPGAAPRAV